MRLSYYLLITLIALSCSDDVGISFDENNLKAMELRKYLPHIKKPVEFIDIIK